MTTENTAPETTNHAWLQSLKKGDEVVYVRIHCRGLEREERLAVVSRVSKNVVTIISPDYGSRPMSKETGYAKDTSGYLGQGFIREIASPEEKAKILDAKKRRDMLCYCKQAFSTLESLPTEGLEQLVHCLKNLKAE